MNNTVAAPHGFRAFSEQKMSAQQPSQLSHYGANIMNYQRPIKRQFLRRRQGNGGSPVPGESKLSDSKNSDDSLIKVGKDKPRDRTTVRIRTKNNQYEYAEASFTNPLNTSKNGYENRHHPNLSYFEQPSLQERERMQAMIAKYREEKIQRQIEKIEQERMKIEMERQKEREDEQRRKRYNERLKQKLNEYQMIRQQEEQERMEMERQNYKRQLLKEHQRQMYFESQKQFIQQYRQQKQRTDELLLIPHAQQQQMIFYQPQTLTQMNSNVVPPLLGLGQISNEGQAFIKSGQGQIEASSKANSLRQQYQQQSNDENYEQKEQNHDEELNQKMQECQNMPQFEENDEEQDSVRSSHTSENDKKDKLDELQNQ